MSVFRRLPTATLRLLLALLLLCGLATQAALASACLADHAAVASSAAPSQDGVGNDDTGDGDCCLSQGCGACCSHVAAIVTPRQPAMTQRCPASLPKRLMLAFRPTAYPVAFRPPIAA